jgi:hypothetical protein
MTLVCITLIVAGSFLARNLAQSGLVVRSSQGDAVRKASGDNPAGADPFCPPFGCLTTAVAQDNSNIQGIQLHVRISPKSVTLPLFRPYTAFYVFIIYIGIV